jgi:hypothetical protein
MLHIDLDSIDTEVVLCFVQTIRGNMEGYTKREVNNARAAPKAQGMVGHPKDKKILGMVPAITIPNCHVSESAVKNANVIFSPDLAGVRERMVCRPPESVWTDYVQIPQIILE